MAHGAVSVDASSGVVVAEVDGAGSGFDVFDDGLDGAVFEPVFDEVSECGDVDSASSIAGSGDERVSGSSVGTDWFFAFSPSPVAFEDFFKWFVHAFPHFGALPEAFDADGFDVCVLVEDGSVGGVAPCPVGFVANFVGVVAGAGVDDDGGGVFDLGPHTDGGEVTHADDFAHHCLRV